MSYMEKELKIKPGARNILFACAISIFSQSCDVIKVEPKSIDSKNPTLQEQQVSKEQKVILLFEKEIDAIFAKFEINQGAKIVGTLKSSEVTRNLIETLRDNDQLNGIKKGSELFIAIDIPKETKKENAEAVQNYVLGMVEEACNISGCVYLPIMIGDNTAYVIGDPSKPSQFEETETLEI